MTKSAPWAALALAVAAAAVALRARKLAADAHALALGHALDRSWHPRPGAAPVLEDFPPDH